MKNILVSIFLCGSIIGFTQNLSIDDFESHAITSETAAHNIISNIEDKTTKSKSISTINNEFFTSMLLKDRLRILNTRTPFDVPYNATVERFIRLYLKDKKVAISNLMDRATYYFPIFEEYLDYSYYYLRLKPKL